MNESTRHHLTVALHALGNTADDVADVLEAGGWRGLRFDPGACPIARYLTALVPDARAVGVGMDEITIFAVNSEDIEVDLPAAVAAFITAFDDGAYQALAGITYDDGDDPVDDCDR